MDPSLQCSPGAAFCDGTRLWTCTKSGHDATAGMDCAGGSATNPPACYQSGCAPGVGACCRATRPLCRWSLTAPLDASGESLGFGMGGAYCTPPSNTCAGTPFTVYWTHLPTSACATATIINLTVTRPVTPGETIALPSARVGLTYLGGGKVCSSWTGSLTVTSELPTWAVSVDATCTTAEATEVQVKGTFSGDA